MSKLKHYVFSARTMEEGLRLLNGLREEKKVWWDDLVIDAVCAHYGLDRLVMALPKAHRPEKPKKEKKAKAKAAKPAKKATKKVANPPLVFTVDTALITLSNGEGLTGDADIFGLSYPF